jgi:aconitate hydratase
VVAYALAGTVMASTDDREPLGKGKRGKVYLRDIWPTSDEIAATAEVRHDRARPTAQLYAEGRQPEPGNPLWERIGGPQG